jgi:hypothetical protein
MHSFTPAAISVIRAPRSPSCHVGRKRALSRNMTVKLVGFLLRRRSGPLLQLRAAAAFNPVRVSGRPQVVIQSDRRITQNAGGGPILAGVAVHYYLSFMYNFCRRLEGYIQFSLIILRIFVPRQIYMFSGTSVPRQICVLK